MGNEIPYEDCKRYKVEFEGENIYVMQGKTFIQGKVPHENRPEQHKLRCTVDAMFDGLTKLMGGSND